MDEVIEPTSGDDTAATDAPEEVPAEETTSEEEAAPEVVENA